MEEKLYDTSALIEVARTNRNITGYTTIINLIEFPKATELEGIRAIYPNRSDYELALVIAARLLKKGTPVPATDMIIAGTCINRRLLLVTRDEHFRQVRDVNSNLSLEILQDNGSRRSRIHD